MTKNIVDSTYHSYVLLVWQVNMKLFGNFVSLSNKKRADENRESNIWKNFASIKSTKCLLLLSITIKVILLVFVVCMCISSGNVHVNYTKIYVRLSCLIMQTDVEAFEKCIFKKVISQYKVNARAFFWNAMEMVTWFCHKNKLYFFIGENSKCAFLISVIIVFAV